VIVAEECPNVRRQRLRVHARRDHEARERVMAFVQDRDRSGVEDGLAELTFEQADESGVTLIHQQIRLQAVTVRY
jgi:hypothetical protein